MSGQAFGKNKLRYKPAPIAALPTDASPLRRGFLQICYAGGLPVVTCGLILLLSGIFLAEMKLANTSSPSPDALLQFGAVNGRLVIDHHQWWRVFTAAMLHSSPAHLIGNCVALFFVGLYLEPVIGAGWLLTIFTASAMGGFAFSLTQHDPDVAAVGASGGILGLFVVQFLYSFRSDDNNGGLQQYYIARLIALNVAPILLPDIASHSNIDYAGHAGGALTGLAAWLVLNNFWDDDEGMAPLPALGAVLGTLATLLTNIGFAITIILYQPAQETIKSALIPDSELPANTRLGTQHSSDFLARFPGDPRSHYFRGLYFYDRNDLSGAADELRKAIALRSARTDGFGTAFGATLNLTLALILNEEGDLQGARDTAKGWCDQPGAYKLSDEARKETVCR